MTRPKLRRKSANIARVALIRHRCITCKVVYHQSCALRLSGMIVFNGSKSLIQCPTCAKNGRDKEINLAIKEAVVPKDMEIVALKSKLADIERTISPVIQPLTAEQTANSANSSNAACCQNGDNGKLQWY